MLLGVALPVIIQVVTKKYIHWVQNLTIFVIQTSVNLFLDLHKHLKSYKVIFISLKSIVKKSYGQLSMVVVKPLSHFCFEHVEVEYYITYMNHHHLKKNFTIF